MDPPHYPSFKDRSEDVDGSSEVEHAADMPVDCPGTNMLETASVLAQDGPSDPQAAFVVEEGDEASTSDTMVPRAYQLEMLAQSLKENVIVAMDTGSGKTQVAVLRIKAELEQCDPAKIVWFLAPTVSLCSQQFEYIQTQMPSVSIKLITGNDNLDTWSPDVWTAILDGVRIVISTYQVLLDALDHAYVKMDNLALLVIDEAHNCVGNSPGSTIMFGHYHRSKHATKPVPAILGLTASPVVKSTVTNIGVLETTLDARCVTPTLHREELLKCVKHPQLSWVTYSIDFCPSSTPSMVSLRNACFNLRLEQDPYIQALLADGSGRSRRELENAVTKKNTFVQRQMHGFYDRSSRMLEELGSWAANHYVAKVIRELTNRIQSEQHLSEDLATREKTYLAEVLRQVDLGPAKDAPETLHEISNKVKVFLKQLLDVEENAVGIIFVRERASVTILADLLRSLPSMDGRYKIGTMIGTSNYSARNKNIYEFNNKGDIESLDKFRSGKINLLIATSVLEEGIDVPACNLVICFDEPANLKVFIQRRGRARMRDSRLVLLLKENSKSPIQWHKLEEDMKRQYEDEDRELQRLEELEEFESTSFTMFTTEKARLSFDNAKQHLEHFCRVIPTGEFVDRRPDYIIELEIQSDELLLKATVLLPSFLPPELRRAEGASAWKSEKNATKDAAFQAYVALYKAGLVNEHLAPFKADDIPGVESRPSELDVELPYQPWGQVAQDWQHPGNRWMYTVSCHDENDNKMGQYNVILPVQLPRPGPMKIFLDYNTQWNLKFGEGHVLSYDEAMNMPDHTSTLLSLHFGHRFTVEERAQVIKVVASDEMLSTRQIGSEVFSLELTEALNGNHLIRDASRTPFLYTDIIPCKPAADQVQKLFYGFEDAPSDVPYLVLRKWTKRADFLHRVASDPDGQTPSTKLYSWVLPVPWATVDATPKRHVQFGMLIPSIIHELEVMLIARELMTKLMKPVGLTDLNLIREAMSSRSANEPLDYERLEFLGDSILKFIVSIQASADYPDYPEGYLSMYKDKLISNSRLSRAALQTHLARYIISKPFTGQKWRPLYLDGFLMPHSSESPKRRLSSKTLADVVEALIGASYVEGNGDTSMVLLCIRQFLSEVDWRDVNASRDILFDRAAAGKGLPPTLEPVEELIGYRFRKKALLLEAMTHGSYTQAAERSFERLEFLGDAILDRIIVSKVFNYENCRLPNYRLHLLKTAMVNGDFLAFMVMEHGLTRKETVMDDEGLKEKHMHLPLWKMMRHNAPAIGVEQRSMEERHRSLRGRVLDALERGTQYPWALLASLQARKYYSDLFEAIIGAVWIDSGSLEACEDIVRRFGILPYLKRVLDENLHVLHPKEELGILAVAETVTYDVKTIDRADGEKELSCEVFIGERGVAYVDGGVDKEEVKTKAAEKAVRVLKEKK